MFTGIIQDIGRIRDIGRSGANLHLLVDSKALTDLIKIGDSVAISGVCLTVESLDAAGSWFRVTAVSETLKCTTLAGLRRGDPVNLELALLPTERLGGHFVQGHVDAVGECVNVAKSGDSWLLRFSYPKKYEELIIDKGSIAVNGVSLTAIEVKGGRFSVSVIPHTLGRTTLQFVGAGTSVNLEFDLIGKYIQRIIKPETTEGLTIEKLGRFGY